MNIVTQIVDRQSVLCTNQEVCRAVISKLEGGLATYLRQPQHWRRQLLSDSIQRLKHNQGVYGYIVLAHDITGAIL